MATNKSFYLNDLDLKNMENIYKYYKDIGVELTPSKLIRYSLFLMNQSINGIENIDSEKLKYLDFTSLKVSSSLDIAVSNMLDS
jgi:hypothetical protein